MMRFLVPVLSVLFFCQPALAVKSVNPNPVEAEKEGANTAGRLAAKSGNPYQSVGSEDVSTGGRISAYAFRLNDIDKLALLKIEKYLTQIETISAEFIQSAPNGDVSSGKFFLQRPGKLRMEYLPPTPVLMVTSGDQIIYYDKELDQITRIPLESTLVGFLARNEVKFDETVTVTRVEHGDKTLNVSLVQAKRPQDGTLTLNFTDEPLALRSLVIRDSAGQVTTVALNNSRFNFPLPPTLFVFKDPHFSSKTGIRK